MSKKEIVEELARDISLQYLRKVTEAYRQYGMSQSPMFDGKIPSFGESDSALSFEFMVVSGILRRALEAAQKASESNHDFIARNHTKETRPCHRFGYLRRLSCLRGEL